MRRRMTLCAIIALIPALLCGCVLKGGEPEASAEIRLPEPTEEPENMILGETLSGAATDVTLYFAAQDGTSFSTVTRSVVRGEGQSLPEAAVAALLSFAAERNIRSLPDTRLLSCEYACKTVTVNLSIDARNVQTPQDLLALQASIGNTLLGLKGVSAVNVLIGNVSESCCQLPLGVQTEMITSVAAAYAQLQAERDRLTQPGNAEPVERTALLYFPSAAGNWLIPELRTVSIRNGSFVLALIDALKAGPRQESSAAPSIPEGVDLLEASPAIQTLSTGERVLELNFSSTLANYLAFSGLEVWKLAGSLSMTLCSFLPELDAVRILVNSDPITMCERAQILIRFPEGLIHRGVFSDCIGSTATLYLVNNEGMLQPVQRAVSMRSALSPRNLLNELILSGSGEGALRFPIPEGVRTVDLLGVQVSGGVARVNLSANFYRCCQVLNALQERSLIYAMVNTLCEMDDIRGVRFYVEGRSAETLAGGIYLKSVLLPNPGIIMPTRSIVQPSATPER